MKLTHPKTSMVVDVDPDHADIYLSQGWVEKPAKKKTTTARASGKSGTAPRNTTKKEGA